MSSRSLTSIQAPVDEDEKLITEGLYSKPEQVLSAEAAMWQADLERSRNRAIVQAMIDGAPPYRTGKDRAMGSPRQTNVNWGQARKALAREEIPYNDLLESLDILGEIPTKFGTEQQRKTWEPKIAEAITEALRKWGSFNYLWQYNVHLFKRDGVSVAFFKDDRDWRWDVYGMQHFKFPNGSKPCEDMLACWSTRVDMNCSQLYQFIKNEDYAKETGWKPSAVRKALEKASPTGINPSDFEKWEAHWKNHDLTYTSSSSPVVKTVFFWWKELNGKISQAILPFNPEADKDQDFMYYKLAKYSSANRLITIFTDGIGTNGDLHSIRGFAHKIYDASVQVNRTMSSFVDAANRAAIPHITGANEDSINSLPFRQHGDYMMLDSGLQFVDQKLPDYGSTLLPIITMAQQFVDGESSGQSFINHITSGGRRTNEQEQNQRADANQLTSGSMTLFFASFERLLKETVRRLARKDYAEDEPGGVEAQYLRYQLVKQGIPLDALYQIDFDRIQVNTGVGKGSAQARMQSIRELEANYAQMDATGKNTLMRMKAAQVAGPRTAELLFPVQEDMRPGQQVENAVLENGFLCSSNPFQIATVKILPDQDHAVHVKEHCTLLQQLFEQITPENPQQMHPVVAPLWEHAVSQWELMDPLDPFYSQAKNMLKQWGEWVTNTSKQLLAEQQRQAEAQMEQGGQPSQGLDAAQLTAFSKVENARAKLQVDLAASEQKMQIEARRAALENAERVQKMQLAQRSAQRG